MTSYSVTILDSLSTDGHFTEAILDYFKYVSANKEYANYTSDDVKKMLKIENKFPDNLVAFADELNKNEICIHIYSINVNGKINWINFPQFKLGKSKTIIPISHVPETQKYHLLLSETNETGEIRLRDKFKTDGRKVLALPFDISKTNILPVELINIPGSSEKSEPIILKVPSEPIVVKIPSEPIIVKVPCENKDIIIKIIDIKHNIHKCESQKETIDFKLKELHDKLVTLNKQINDLQPKKNQRDTKYAEMLHENGRIDAIINELYDKINEEENFIAGYKKYYLNFTCVTVEDHARKKRFESAPYCIVEFKNQLDHCVREFSLQYINMTNMKSQLDNVTNMMSHVQSNIHECECEIKKLSEEKNIINDTITLLTNEMKSLC